ncbi:MAG: hypothetical protein U1F06_08630 [Steroidobacteraceae bacterium]
MDGLLDPASGGAIAAYLERNAGYPRRGESATAQPTLRITETEWFRREHHELTPAAPRRRISTSAADCSACHGAARGEFEEEHGERGGHGERHEHGG